MGIFDNLFGSRPDYKLPEIPTTKVGEAVADAQQKDEATGPCYQVGFTADGRVTLKIGSDYYADTLTMTSEGVRHLIQVLEAAIPESVVPEYVVPDNVEENEDKE